MKTKEDILDELTEGRKGLFNDDVQVSFDDALKAMQEYADQQTEQLKKQLEEKDREIESIKVVSDFQKYAYEQLQSQLSEKENALEASERLNAKHVGYIEKLEAELNEYKEKAILWDNLKTGDKLNSLVGGDSKFCEKVDKDKIKRLEAELSELKAKHKEEIIKFSEFLKDYEYIMSLGLKYGAYVNKNEVDIYVNGSELHYQNLVLNHGKSINELYEQYYTQTHG